MPVSAAAAAFVQLAVSERHHPSRRPPLPLLLSSTKYRTPTPSTAFASTAGHEEQASRMCCVVKVNDPWTTIHLDGWMSSDPRGSLFVLVLLVRMQIQCTYGSIVKGRHHHGDALTSRACPHPCPESTRVLPCVASPRHSSHSRPTSPNLLVSRAFVAERREISSWVLSIVVRGITSPVNP